MGDKRNFDYLSQAVRFFLISILLTTSSSCAAEPAVLIKNEYQIRISEDSIFFDGKVSVEAAADFDDFLKKNYAEKLKKLHITSAGGDGVAGQAIGKLVQFYDLDVEVSKYCVSACAANIFVAGKKKLIGPDALVAFHASTITQLWALERSPLKQAIPIFKNFSENKKLFYDTLGIDHALLAGGIWGLLPQCVLENPKVDSGAYRFGVFYMKNAWIPSKPLLESTGVKNVQGSWPNSSKEIERRALKYFNDKFSVSFLSKFKAPPDNVTFKICQYLNK